MRAAQGSAGGVSPYAVSNSQGFQSGNAFFLAGAFVGVSVILSALFSPFSSQNIQGTLESYSKPVVLQEALFAPAAQFAVNIAEEIIPPAHTKYSESFGPIAPDYMLSRKITLEVKPGDTLADLLVNSGIERQDAYAAIQAMKPVFSPRKIRVGQEVQIGLEPTASITNPKLGYFLVEMSPLKQVEVRLNEGEYQAVMNERVADTDLARARGVIHSSFYQAGDDAGLNASVIMELMNAFSFDVDFQRDIKSGQQLEVLFEQHLDEQENVIGQGNIKYAAFQLGKKKLEIYRYEDSDGNVGYYHPNGQSVRTALLRTPVDGARISSGFGMRRHPVLGYSKMHKGIDFAAPTGTPVYAAGDGVVKKASRWGGYGNYLRIKHNGTYDTAYAHLHRFAKGVKPGKRVKQGQIVAYVGSTGRSTGPHLHYEILKGGKHANPSKVKFKSGRQLEGKELTSFNAQKEEWLTKLANLPPITSQMALATE